MTIAPIQNGEAGLSVRNKLNEAITGVNSTMFVPPIIQFTGEWGYSFALEPRAPVTLMFMPSGIVETAVGAWLYDFDTEGHYDLLTLAFPNLVGVVEDFLIYDFESLTSLGLPELQIVGDYFEIENCGALETISVPKLRIVGNEFEIYNCDVLESMSFPELVTVNSNFYISNNYVLEEISFPKLEVIDGTLYIYDNYEVTSVSFPVLKHTRYGLQMEDMYALTSIEFPALEYCGGINFYDMYDLTSFTIGDSLKAMQGDVQLNTTLDQASVDRILIQLAALDGTNGTTRFEDRYVYIGGSNAEPSPAGIAAIEILESGGRSNYVDYNHPEPIVLSNSTVASDAEDDTLVGLVTPFITHLDAAYYEWTLEDNGKGQFKLTGEYGDELRVNGTLYSLPVEIAISGGGYDSEGNLVTAEYFVWFEILEAE